ncbi:MAG TPA: energy transducer TonB [Dongiaceae bacterium]|nr:energy transducer TonB [Dongiaceae bacterium]
MKARVFWVLILFLPILAASPVSSRAQNSDSDRKLLTRVEPDYPPVLRMRQIGGTVKLQLTIAASGAVESAKVLGGNPILAESAVSAVKKWKYAATGASTTATVSLEFNPYR